MTPILPILTLVFAVLALAAGLFAFFLFNDNIRLSEEVEAKEKVLKAHEEAIKDQEITITRMLKQIKILEQI